VTLAVEGVAVGLVKALVELVEGVFVLWVEAVVELVHCLLASRIQSSHCEQEQRLRLERVPELRRW
jgi:hypothetical protein